MSLDSSFEMIDCTEFRGFDKTESSAPLSKNAVSAFQIPCKLYYTSSTLWKIPEEISR